MEAMVFGVEVLWSSIFVTVVTKKSLDCCLVSIGAVRFHQGCFQHRCCGSVLNKICPLQFRLIKQSNRTVCCRLSLCLFYDSCLIWCTVIIVAVWAYMIISDVGEFFYCLAERFLCLELI